MSNEFGVVAMETISRESEIIFGCRPECLVGVFCLMRPIFLCGLCRQSELETSHPNGLDLNYLFSFRLHRRVLVQTSEI